MQRRRQHPPQNPLARRPEPCRGQQAHRKIVAADNEKIGPDIFHCTWSSPALGEFDGKRLVFFVGGNGVCYAFDALPGLPADPAAAPAMLQRFTRYDPDPSAPKTDVHRFTGNREESPSVVMGMPVLDGGRVYLVAGGDLWWGKKRSWLKCFTPKPGETTPSDEAWTYPMPRESSCTPAVFDGMVFAADCSGTIHCVDAATAQRFFDNPIHAAADK